MIPELILLAGTSLRAHGSPDSDLEAVAVEWRSECNALAGARITDEGDRFWYAGFHEDIDLGRGWRLTPSIAAGLYDSTPEGRRKAEPLQLMGRLELTKQVADQWRVGLAADHFSNGELYTPNDSAEFVSVLVTWTPR